MANDTLAVIQSSIQVRQARALCSTLTTAYVHHQRGLYSSTVYHQTYYCPGPPTVLLVPSAGAFTATTSTANQGTAPQSTIATTATSESVPAQKSPPSSPLAPEVAGGLCCFGNCHCNLDRDPVVHLPEEPDKAGTEGNQRSEAAPSRPTSWTR